MPMRIQAASCTGPDQTRARNEAVLSEAAGAARNRYQTHGETANGAAASAKSELVTYAYYVRTFKYYAPAIYPGQGLARYGRMGSDYYPMSKK